MALPKNKGIRKIKVGNIEYYWKFDTDPEKKELKVTIGKVSEPNKRIILSAKYADIWLYFSEKEVVEANEIKIVTPELIKRTIKFAIGNGWESQEKIKSFKIKIENSIFEVIE